MNTATATKKDNVFLGVCIIIATVMTMAFADAVIKYLSADFPLWQIFVVRSLVAVPILVVIVLFGSRPGSIRPLSLKWAIVRSVLLALMYIAIYAAAPVLPLSVIAAALYTGPIFVALLSTLLLGEPAGMRTWGAVVLGFAGVLVILRPDSDDFSLFMLIPVIAGLLYALAAIITRAKCIDEKPQVLAIMLNLSILAVGLIATGALVLLRPLIENTANYPFLLGGWIAMGPWEWKMIALLAFLIVLIGIGLAKAYQAAPPPLIATFDYTYLLFAAFWGFLFFSAIPDPATIAGMLLIVAAGFLVIGFSPASAE